MGARFVVPRVSRRYLRIPRVDWALITQGHKTELRARGRHAILAQKLHTPTPVVGYTVGVAGQRFALLVIEEAWSEPLVTISPESLEREGFKTRAEFRSYWRRRTGEGFKALTNVQVYRLRPFTPEDRAPLADRMFDHLYGEYADA